MIDRMIRGLFFGSIAAGAIAIVIGAALVADAAIARGAAGTSGTIVGPNGAYIEHPLDGAASGRVKVHFGPGSVSARVSIKGEDGRFGTCYAPRRCDGYHPLTRSGVPDDHRLVLVIRYRQSGITANYRLIGPAGVVMSARHRVVSTYELGPATAVRITSPDIAYVGPVRIFRTDR